MELSEIARLWKKLQGLEENLPQSHYARIDVDFSESRNQGNDVVVEVYGDYLARIKYDGDVGDCTVRFSHRNAQKLPVTEFKKQLGLYSKLYLSSTDTSGHFIFLVGGQFAGEIEPSAGSEVGLINSNGANVDPATEGTLEDVKTATESLDANAFDSATDTIKLGFSGAVYSKQQNSTNALVAVGATKLRDVVIMNTDAANAVDLGETAADVATFRAASLELAPGASIGFTQVNLATLFVLSSVAGSHGRISVLGVEE